MFDTDAPLPVDLFLLLLIVILPALYVAVALVRRGKVRAHATIMIVCFVLFLIGVTSFEVQVQFGEAGPPLATTPLVIHLCFAFPGLLLWIYQMSRAKRVSKEPAAHRKRGRVLLALLTLTVVTGIWVYFQTFV